MMEVKLLDQLRGVKTVGLQVTSFSPLVDPALSSSHRFYGLAHAYL